jgi:methyl-accepting chemotaxis protein
MINMNTSILRKLLVAFLGFGLLIGIMFPFFASLFADYKDGFYIWFVLSCLVVGLLIGAINYYLLHKYLISKLKDLAKLFNAISNNDLSTTYELDSDDVVGDMANSYNKMSDNLRTIISELVKSSEQINSGVDLICVDANATSGGVKNQNSQIQDIQESIEQLTQIAEEVSERAVEAEKTATQAKNDSKAGSDVVDQTISSITSLADAVESASASLNQLKDESVNIGGVLDVIQGISEQTNLLALNAAIEAARAGEQGRGFAVVADEVRTLAQRTKESTSEIQKMIDTLQSVSLKAVSVMEKGQQQAEESVNCATEAGLSLEGISQSIENISQINQQISNVANSQSGVASEINNTIHSISAIATESMNAAERTNDESQSLSTEASNLLKIVKKFKI